MEIKKNKKPYIFSLSEDANNMLNECVNLINEKKEGKINRSLIIESLIKKLNEDLKKK